MLRYKTITRPGLVALYDIRPGNGAGPFLQPRSPHGAYPFSSLTGRTSGPLIILDPAILKGSSLRDLWGTQLNLESDLGN